MNEAKRIAVLIAAKAPLAIAACKRAINNGASKTSPERPRNRKGRHQGPLNDQIHDPDDDTAGVGAACEHHRRIDDLWPRAGPKRGGGRGDSHPPNMRRVVTLREL